MASLSPAHRPGCARLAMMRLNATRLGFYESIIGGYVGGAPVGTQPGVGLRIDGASIDQILNDQVDTASFRTRGFTPAAGQTIDVYGGDRSAAQQIFGGRIIETTQLYESRKQNLAHDLRCVDPTWLLNRRTVLWQYINAAVSNIVIDLINRFTRGVTFNHVQPNETLIDRITFTNEYVPVCLTAVAERVGAHWYLDYQNDLHFFTSEEPDANPITDAAPHTAVDLALTEDLSQVVTKVIGRGGGARCAIDTPLGASELPVDEDQESWYSPTGGLVETGVQAVWYSGVKGRGGKGSYIGVGNAPSGAPKPTPTGGSTHVVGAVYKYAATFATASGETLAGPVGSITIASLPMQPPSAISGRTRGSGSYPPGMLSPRGGPIRFRAQIWYTGGAVGPVGNIGPEYSWDGNDWEIDIGPYQAVGSGGYYPALEPGGFVAPVQHVAILRSDNGGTFYHANYCAFAGSSPGWYREMCAGYSTSPANPVSGFGSVQVTEIPKGPVGVTGRKLYRTAQNGSALLLLTTIANNTDTSYTDTSADAALGAAPPTSDTSGIKDDGQVLPGTTTLPVASTQPFTEDVGPSGGGGWVRIGAMPVKYGGIGANALTGIPATGHGSITAATRYGTPVLVQPRLYGIPPYGEYGAMIVPVARGDAVLIRIEKTDTTARDQMAQRLQTPGVAVNPDDGIIELVVSDSRFGLAELQEHVDATLLDRKDPQYTLTFGSRDLSLQVGRLITVNTTQPPINYTFRIHKITLTEIAIAGGRATAHPLKRVEASSKIYKFTDLLRRLRSVEAGGHN